MNLETYLSHLEESLTTVLNDHSYRNGRYQVRSKDLLFALSPEEIEQIRYDYRPERLTRTATYAFEAASRLLLSGRPIERFSAALHEAAEVFEHLLGLGEGPKPDTSRLLSAALYQLAGYQANSMCLARSVEMPSLPREISASSFPDVLHRWSKLLLERKYVRTLWESRRLAEVLEDSALAGLVDG